MFLVVGYSKMGVEREKLLSKMEPALDDLGGSWSIQTAKNAKVRTVMVEAVCSVKKIKCVTGQCFAEEIRYVTHRYRHGVIQERSMENLI